MDLVANFEVLVSIAKPQLLLPPVLSPRFNLCFSSFYKAYFYSKVPLSIFISFKFKDHKYASPFESDPQPSTKLPAR